VLNRLVFVAFFGTAAGCGLLIVTSLWTWPEPGAIYHIIVGALYLVGTILVTIVLTFRGKTRWQRLIQRAPKAHLMGSLSQ
jgi:uncharacterized membrane protein